MNLRSVSRVKKKTNKCCLSEVNVVFYMETLIWQDVKCRIIFEGAILWNKFLSIFRTY